MTYDADSRQCYLSELIIALGKGGFDAQKTQRDELAIQYNGKPLCKVESPGGITYRNEDVATDDHIQAKDKAYGIVRTVTEYMRLMEQAPTLTVSDLDDKYKLLSEFNGTILAGMTSKYGVQFVTWDRDFSGEGVCQGHYYGDNYDGAKQDFASRSHLVDKDTQFSKEQLVHIYRCCSDTLDGDYNLTYEQEQEIKGIQEQIENTVPDINERIVEQDEKLDEALSMNMTM